MCSLNGVFPDPSRRPPPRTRRWAGRRCGYSPSPIRPSTKCRWTAGREDLEQGLTFAGLVGMIDPPRPEAVDAIRECDAAGIRTVMITGDHVVTASAIARQLGILHDDGEAVTGRSARRHERRGAV